MIGSGRPKPRMDSLAVVSFHNLLADEERQYLVDGRGSISGIDTCQPTVLLHWHGQ
jgi:hypothetical protein